MSTTGHRNGREFFGGSLEIVAASRSVTEIESIVVGRLFENLVTDVVGCGTTSEAVVGGILPRVPTKDTKLESQSREHIRGWGVGRRLVHRLGINDDNQTDLVGKIGVLRGVTTRDRPTKGRRISSIIKAVAHLVRPWLLSCGGGDTKIVDVLLDAIGQRGSDTIQERPVDKGTFLNFLGLVTIVF